MRISALPGIPAPIVKKAEGETVTLTPPTLEAGAPWLGRILGGGVGTAAGGKVLYDILKGLSEHTSVPFRTGTGLGSGHIQNIMKSLPEVFAGTPAARGTPAVPGFLGQRGIRGALKEQLGTLNLQKVLRRASDPPRAIREITEHLTRAPLLQGRQGRSAANWLAEEIRRQTASRAGVGAPTAGTLQPDAIKDLLKRLGRVTRQRTPAGAGVAGGIPPEIMNVIKRQLGSFNPQSNELLRKLFRAGPKAPTAAQIAAHLQKAPRLQAQQYKPLVDYAAQRAAKAYGARKPGILGAWRRLPRRRLQSGIGMLIPLLLGLAGGYGGGKLLGA
jgi:hypothetical protein